MTPMAEAVYAGQLKLVLALAAHNATLDAKSKHSITPMALAVCAGQWEVVHDLVARKAKFKCKELGWHDSNG